MLISPPPGRCHAVLVFAAAANVVAPRCQFQALTFLARRTSHASRDCRRTSPTGGCLCAVCYAILTISKSCCFEGFQLTRTHFRLALSSRMHTFRPPFALWDLHLVNAAG